MKTSSCGVLASLFVALSLAGAARAATINTTLNELLVDPDGVQIGDKIYYDFTFSSTGDAPPLASGVGVSLISDDVANQYQIRFNFGLDPLDAGAGQTTDVVIGYKVRVDGPQLINRVG